MGCSQSASGWKPYERAQRFEALAPGEATLH
jgi:hypothetical protein